LLVTVTDNIKFLVLGPLLVGLAALGVGYMLPQTVQSTSLLAVEKTGGSLNANVVATLAQLLAPNSARLFTIQNQEAQLAGLQPSDLLCPLQFIFL